MPTLKHIFARKAGSGSASFIPTFKSSRLQRKCACGGTAGTSGECEACRRKRLLRQAKTIPSSGTKVSEAAYPSSKRPGTFPPIPQLSASPRLSPDFSKILIRPSWLSTPVLARSSPTSPPLLGAIQPKLAVGRVDDPLEYEADRIADQVVRMPAPRFPGAAVSSQLCRRRAAFDHGEKSQTLQTKLVGSPQATSNEAPDTVDEVLRRPGQALDSTFRAFFEPRFGHDFSRVRVHTGRDADQSARSIGALAYTVGRNIVFREGHSDTETVPGKRLLAHELAHVVQQSHARPLQPRHILQRANSEESLVNEGYPNTAVSPMKLSTAQMPRLFRQQDVSMGSLGPSNPDAASDEGQNRESDVEWVPQASVAANSGALVGQSSDQLSGAPPTTPEITLETGNIGASPINNAIHQQVCVNMGFGGGKDCYSFAATGAQAPEFSSTWLGWDSTVVGAVLKGEVYHPDPVPGATVASRLTPTAAQAVKWNSYMVGTRLGLQDGYSVARHNCRTFSQWEFRDAPSHW
jgi:hypothetical protein